MTLQVERLLNILRKANDSDQTSHNSLDTNMDSGQWPSETDMDNSIVHNSSSEQRPSNSCAC